MPLPPECFPSDLPVRRHLAGTPDAADWLDRLPQQVAALCARWELRPSAPFRGGSCSWAAPVRRADGTGAVLKVTWPHPEAAGEAEALRRWDGRGAVRVLASDPDRYALLLERCSPGTGLGAVSRLPDREALDAGAGVLGTLWVPAPELSGAAAALPALAGVCARWSALVVGRMARLRPDHDPGLVALGARLLTELPAGADRSVLLHGDANPGNILAAARAPWLAIDPKPMLGDPAYDPWPLVQQLPGPTPLAERFARVADRTGLSAPRMLSWAAARSVEQALWADSRGRPADGAAAMARARTTAALAGH